MFTKKIEPQTVTAGEEKAIFEIELSKGDAITKWFKDGREIEQSEHVQLKIDGKKQRLEIHNVELTDAGEVSCTIGNEKCQAKLVVEEPKVRGKWSDPDNRMFEVCCPFLGQLCCQTCSSDNWYSWSRCENYSYLD